MSASLRWDIVPKYENMWSSACLTEMGEEDMCKMSFWSYFDKVFVVMMDPYHTDFISQACCLGNDRNGSSF